MEAGGVDGEKTWITTNLLVLDWVTLVEGLGIFDPSSPESRVYL